MLADLSSTLATNRAHIESLERRARALQTSSDSFGVVAADVAACIRLLEEIGAELAKEDEDNAKKSRQRDALTERGADVKEVERAESMLQKQLAKWNERTERLREQSAQKAAEARDKMEELKGVHRTLNEERTEKARDMEKRRVRIEQTEKKVSRPGCLSTFPLLLTRSCRCSTSRKTLKTRSTMPMTNTSRWSRMSSCTSQSWSRRYEGCSFICLLACLRAFDESCRRGVRDELDTIRRLWRWDGGDSESGRHV